MTFRRQFITAPLALIGLLLLLVTLTPAVFWYATWLAGPWNDPPGEVLILLSASAESSGLLARDSYLRASYGVLAWRSGSFRHIVICGRDAGPPMRDFLVANGVPPEAIFLEDQSRSTRENALFSLPIVRRLPGRKVLLTSDFHMYRAFRTFRRAGIDVLPRPIPDVRKYSNRYAFRWPIFMDLSAETAKILYYRWQGWL
jgi:uncharacterized SAM-binding protein YcdF (DUF218 family)